MKGKLSWGSTLNMDLGMDGICKCISVRNLVKEI